MGCSRRRRRRCHTATTSAGQRWLQLAIDKSASSPSRRDELRGLFFAAQNFNAPLPDGLEAQIRLDIGRTFPQCPLFAATTAADDAPVETAATGIAARGGGVGRKYLLDILRAYALLDAEVGYVQGMNVL